MVSGSFASHGSLQHQQQTNGGGICTQCGTEPAAHRHIVSIVRTMINNNGAATIYVSGVAIDMPYKLSLVNQVPRKSLSSSANMNPSPRHHQQHHLLHLCTNYSCFFNIGIVELQFQRKLDTNSFIWPWLRVIFCWQALSHSPRPSNNSSLQACNSSSHSGRNLDWRRR